MEQIASNVILQLGAIGVMLLFMFIFSRVMFNYFMQLVKEEREKYENLNTEYKNSINEDKERLLNIISKNTDAYKEMTKVIERYLNKK